ncbi:MAG TPA: RNB domain-containing ribonuclease, partial [Spirochaetota bacterium]|nr:RNB domain-containing ribonuclease [Spirochaetota bacterium]
PPEVAAEVDAIMSVNPADDPSLHDYTHLPFVTIDNEESRDLDQAVYVERHNDDYKIFYAIADACYFVRPGSALFSESLKRGASFYLPSFSVPMLPRELSEDIISLNAGVNRRALLFIMRIDSSGKAGGTEIKRCIIRSRAKLSYSGVQSFYDNPGQGPLYGQEYSGSLILLQQAGLLLAATSAGRGVINFERYELEVRISDDGESLIYRDQPRSNAARWNEQVSLLCNMEGVAIAAQLNGSGNNHAQNVFRIHEPPDDSALARLYEIIRSITAAHSLDPAVWLWKRGSESPGEYLSRLPRSGDKARITGTIERQILLTNQKSFFSNVPGVHHALRADLYGRYSSPMREIVGIFSHKELLEKLLIDPPAPVTQDETIRDAVIESSNRAKETQRKLDRLVDELVLDQLFAPEAGKTSGQTFSGTIMGMKDSKMYVLLDSPRIEIKVYTGDIEQAAGCRLTYKFHELRSADKSDGPAYRAGDKVELKVLHKDDAGKWRLVPADLSA